MWRIFSGRMAESKWYGEENGIREQKGLNFIGDRKQLGGEHNGES